MRICDASFSRVIHSEITPMKIPPCKPLSNSPLSFGDVEKLLLSFSSAVMQEEHREGVFQCISNHVMTELGISQFAIYCYDKRTGRLLLATHGTSMPGADRFTNWTPDYDETKEGRVHQGSLSIPIRHGEKTVGMILCEPSKGTFFSEQHVRILGAVASISAIKLGHLEVQTSIRNREARLLRARQQMAELKVKAIRAQMNPHFVFNALNAVQHFITLNDKRNALRFLGAFSKLVRLYLRHMEKDVIHLVHEMDVIGQYLKLQRLRYDGMFDFTVALTGDDFDQVKVPALITQLIIEEGVENLAKNNVAGKMDIKVNVLGNKVMLAIDTQIPSDGNASTEFSTRYTNEFTNWHHHVMLLKQLHHYAISTRKQIIQKEDVMHHILHVTLPCV